MKSLTLVLCLISLSLFSQTKESFYVVNLLGTTIYSEPDFDSQIIGRIDLGKIIYFEGVLEQKVKKRVSPELETEGRWIEIVLDYTVGYVFSGDLSTKPTELIIGFKDLQTVSLLGKQLHKKEYTDSVTFDGKNYAVQKIETSYEFGMATESFFDGCHDQELFLEGFTLSEAYHQLINYTARKKNNQIEIPAIISREGNIWNFSNLDAIQELQLHDLGGGRFKITLYSCT